MSDVGESESSVRPSVTRTCGECGLEKPLGEFYATRKTRKCKACQLAIGKRRYQVNKLEKLGRARQITVAIYGLTSDSCRPSLIQSVR